jgi:primosomal protein N' (replication factor Y)
MNFKDKAIFIKNADIQIKNSCQVIIISPGKGVFDYKVNGVVNIGQVVSVPLRKKIYIGIIIAKGSNNFPPYKLKDIIELYKLPLLPIEILNFCFWMSDWYMSDASHVLKMVIPTLNFIIPIKSKQVLKINNKSIVSPTILGEKVLQYLKKTPGLTIKECSKEVKVSDGVIKKLILDQVLFIDDENQKQYKKIIKENIPKLNQHQLDAVKKIKSIADKDNSSIFLLDGVTGSGKTEIYLELISSEIKQGKQSLILLPEIALSKQFIDRFVKRFNFMPAIWHSEISNKEKRKTWQKAINGEAKVVIGARSALFLPLSDLSLIVVDEEHDSSYKQEDGVIYNARDMAVVRGNFSNSKVILASATPSLESVHNANIGKYNRVVLPERFGSAVMPVIKIIDMRKEKLSSKQWIAKESTQAIKKALDKKEQVLLYINRRGYSPLTLCRTCGYRFQCINCSSWLVNHKVMNKMLCHYCGYKEFIKNECPNCESEEEFVPCGPGVERLAAEAKVLFPEAKLEIIASDTIDSLREKENIFNAVILGKIDIVVGTQLVAKGHHFPNLTTVIAIDADLGLSGGDLRASERTFQMLTQLTGRAGRERKKGYAYIQSYDPKHTVMEAMQTGSVKNFIKAEAEGRKNTGLPPYGRLGALIIQSSNLDALENFVKELTSKIPKIHKNKDRIDILGPAPAPIAKLRGLYRYRFLVKGKGEVRLQAFIKEWLSNIKVDRAIRIKIDIDPYNFL